jgi:hypothetical protein
MTRDGQYRFAWADGQDWQLRARCGGRADEFHGLTTAPQRERAGAICTDCPVRGECLEHALESPWQPSGIWGGEIQSAVVERWRQRHPHVSPTERHSQVLRLIGAG